MSRQNIAGKCTAIALLWLVIVMPTFAMTIDNFNSWTLLQDPPHIGMASSIDSSAKVTLTANGPIPAGTDIGYQSVNDNNVSGSSLGSYFSASQDFQIAVDFTLNSFSSIGFAAIGFGVGEDSAGTNSAGALLTMLNGGPPAFTGGARINDVSQTQLPVPVTSSGRFFVQFDSLSGDITYGMNPDYGSTTPSYTGTFSGIQKNWSGKDLLVSFFLRSDNPLGLPSLTSGTVSAEFSNFEVLQGSPVSMVPLPAAVWLFGFGLAGLIGIARLQARA